MSSVVLKAAIDYLYGQEQSTRPQSCEICTNCCGIPQAV
uniref:Uncharacterized protein n=1 Tax=Arundo donax TaxID=35708 RepID=A0A0A9BD44_ARUDO